MKAEPHLQNPKSKPMKKIISILVVIFTFSSLYSQTQQTEFRLSMRDGNTISGVVKINSIDLTTKWGKLNFPIKNVSQIVFGVSPDLSQKDKIKSLVLDLNNMNESIREKAYQSLIVMSINTIPVIEMLINSDEIPEPTNSDYTVDQALSELKAKYNYESNISEEDVLVTDNAYRIGGICSVKDISLKTEYGTLEVPKDKIMSIEVYTTGGSATESSYTLMANKHITGNTAGGWLKTNLMIKSGQKINITATGEITLASLSGYKYKPDGKSSSTSDYDYESEYNPASGTYPTYGNVVFKIGENGTMIKAGAVYRGIATASGLLYLSIYETVYNAANTGSYQVRVKLNQ